MQYLPNLNAVRAFEAAARHESFARAATELRVTQAAVSRHVRNLEAELGLVLFERSHRSIRLTPEGRAYAERVSEGLSIIRGSPGIGRAGRRSKVVVDIDADLMDSWLLPRIRDEWLVEIGIELDLRSQLDWPRQLPTDTDLAIIWGGYESPGFRSSPFLESRAFIVCAPVLGNGRATPSHLIEYLEHRLIHERNAEWWRRMLSAEGLSLSDADDNLYLGRTSLVAAAAVRGLGLAVGEDVIFAEDLKAGRLVRLPGPVMPGSRMFFLLEPTRRMPDKVRIVRDWLRAEASSHQAWQRTLR